MSATSKTIDRRPVLLLSPALVFITVLVVIPMAFILVYSFYENIDLAVDVPAFQFGNWHELFTDSYYHKAKNKWMPLNASMTIRNPKRREVYVFSVSGNTGRIRCRGITVPGDV